MNKIRQTLPRASLAGGSYEVGLDSSALYLEPGNFLRAPSYGHRGEIDGGFRCVSEAFTPRTKP